MRRMKLSSAFTLIEPGPVVWVTTENPPNDNVMTISWTMVVDFKPRFAITTGPWNHSFAALRKRRECVIAIPTIDLLDQVLGVGTFIVDGRRLNRKQRMASKLPAGL
jgi:flavin reductase (DIM6/NTAB) family NADH-FMN oxidoreductase RutF